MNKTCENCLMFTHCRYNLNGNGERCDHFKDKSRYIELPCAVDDTVYFIETCRTAEDFGKQYVTWGRVLQVTFNVFGQWLLLTDKRLLEMDEVFLTKEDAEKALKGGAE